MKARGTGMYTPSLLKMQRFNISPEVQACTARAEQALVRMEDKALYGRVSGSLKRVLARIEAVSTIRIEGKAPRLIALLQLEACASSEGARVRDEAFDFFGFECEEEKQAAIEVLYFERALDNV